MIANQLRVKEVELYIPTVGFTPLNETDHSLKNKWSGFPIWDRDIALELVKQLNIESRDGPIGMGTIKRYCIVDESGYIVSVGMYDFYSESTKLPPAIAQNPWPLRTPWFPTKEKAEEMLERVVKHVHAVIDNLPQKRRIGSSKWWMKTLRPGLTETEERRKEHTKSESFLENKKIGSLKVGKS